MDQLIDFSFTRYMATEIGARNFTDTNRYNLLKVREITKQKN